MNDINFKYSPFPTDLDNTGHYRLICDFDCVLAHISVLQGGIFKNYFNVRTKGKTYETMHSFESDLAAAKHSLIEYYNSWMKRGGLDQYPSH